MTQESSRLITICVRRDIYIGK